MLEPAQELEEIWLPPWLEKQLTVLANHKGVDPEGLLVAAAMLGWERLKDMSAEQIIAVLEEAALR